MTVRAGLVCGALLLGLLAATDALGADGWHRTRDDGLEAARKSGKPVLVVTLWGNGV